MGGWVEGSVSSALQLSGKQLFYNEVLFALSLYRGITPIDQAGQSAITITVPEKSGFNRAVQTTYRERIGI